MIKNLRYKCVECSTDVFRVGNGVREDLKLCGRCSRSKKVVKKHDVKPPSKAVEARSRVDLTVDDVFQPINPEITPVIHGDVDNTRDVIERFKTYHTIYLKAVDLFLESRDHSETFLELWLEAKRRLA
jgi:hypothetical protein